MRAFLVLMVLLPCFAQAQIYRWTDEQGRVQFGQHPPAHAEQVDVRAQVMEKDQQTREREARAARFFDARRDERTEQAAERESRRAEQAQHCALAKGNLARLSGGGTYFRQTADGEREYFSDAQIQAARRQWQEQVAQHCN